MLDSVRSDVSIGAIVGTMRAKRERSTTKSHLTTVRWELDPFESPFMHDHVFTDAHTGIHSIRDMAFGVFGSVQHGHTVSKSRVSSPYGFTSCFNRGNNSAICNKKSCYSFQPFSLLLLRRTM